MIGLVVLGAVAEVRAEDAARAVAIFPTDRDGSHRQLALDVAQAQRGELEIAHVDLTQQRFFSADAYRKLFLAMWAQVPNWKSGDPLWIKRAEPIFAQAPKGQPRLKKPPRHDPEKLDWFEALLTIDLAELEQPFAFEEMPKVELPPVPATDREALRRDALSVVAQVRALAATKSADAVEPLWKLAFVLDGVFRDECGRQIRALGDVAVAPLVRYQYQKNQGAVSLAKQRRYAVYQLDRMDRARPSKAIAVAPDDGVRAQIIHAYGEARAPDAVDAVLEQVNAQSHRVRREARWAFRRYVEGPPPTAAPMRKRRLPGGKEEATAKPDYLTYREIAELALSHRLAEIGRTLPDVHPTPLAMFETIVAKDDAERAAEWERMFETAKTHAAAGDVLAAVDEYEWVLAHDPATSRRAEIAPTYAQAAELEQKAGQLDEAAGLYWKAASLASGDEVSRLEAEAAFLDAVRAEKAGVSDEKALRNVLSRRPDHAGAKQRLAAVERERERGGTRKAALIAGGLFASLACGVWLLWRPRRPHTAA